MKKCDNAEAYEAIDPPICRPVCKSCKAKWEDTLRARALKARQTARAVRA